MSAGTGARADLFAETLVRSYVDDPRFVARGWLADRIDTELAGPDCRFVLLTGEPGSGKTAFMAWLARRWPDALRYFIRRDSRSPLDAADARSLLLSLGHQLAHRRPELFQPERLEVVVCQRVDSVEMGGRLSGIRVADLQVSPFYQTALRVEQTVGRVAGELEGIAVGRMVVEDRLLEPGLLQFLALLDPAALLQRDLPEERIMVLIDALDELRYHHVAPSALDWLASCPELPPSVRVICSSRPDDELLATFRGRQATWLREVPLLASSDEAHGDVVRYARAWAAEPASAQLIAGADGSVDAFAEEAGQRADGNFQYLVALLRAVEAADSTSAGAVVRLERVPGGLDELYAFFLDLLRDTVRDARIPLGLAGEDGYASAWDAVYRPVLSVLAVARAPLTLLELASLGPTGVDAATVADGVARLEQFLDREDDRLRLYHASLAEYLTAPTTAERHPTDHVDAAAWHRRIGLRTAAGDWAGAVDGYPVRYAFEHLALALKAGAVAGATEIGGHLEKLAGDPAYGEAKARALGIDALLNDLLLADDVVGHVPAIADALHVYSQEAHDLRGWDDAERPAWFAQCVHNRALALGYEGLATAAARRLDASGAPQIRLRWRTQRSSPALLSILRGHESWAVSVAITADGRKAVSGGRDGSVRGWDLRTGREEWAAQVLGESGDVWRVALSADARHAVVAADGAAPALLDARTGEVLRPLDAKYREAAAVTILADGRRVVTASGLGVTTWEVESGASLRQLNGLGQIRDLQALADGRVAALAFTEAVVTVFDPNTGEVSAVLKPPSRSSSAYGTGVALSADGRRAVVARADGPVLVWDVAQQRVERELDHGDETVFSVAVTPDGRRALTGADPSVTLWDLDRGERLDTLTGHSSQVRGVALTADARRAVSAGAENDLLVWELERTRQARFSAGHTYSVNGVALSADGRVAASASVDSLVKVFDTHSGRELHTLADNSGFVRDVELMPDGTIVIAAGLDRTVRAWRTSDGKSIAVLRGHKHWVTEVTTAAGGNAVLSGSHDETVRVWRPGSRRRRHSLLLQAGFPVEALAVGDDETIVAAGGNRIVRARIDDRAPLHELDGLNEAVTNLAVEPGSRRVLISGNDGSLTLWEPATGTARRIPPPRPSKAFPSAGSGGHRGDAATAFLDRSLVLVARAHGVIEVLDLDKDAVLAVAPFDHPPVSVAALADGTMLVGDRGGDVHCFEWRER